MAISSPPVTVSTVRCYSPSESDSHVSYDLTSEALKLVPTGVSAVITAGPATPSGHERLVSCHVGAMSVLCMPVSGGPIVPVTGNVTGSLTSLGGLACHCPHVWYGSGVVDAVYTMSPVSSLSGRVSLLSVVSVIPSNSFVVLVVSGSLETPSGATVVVASSSIVASVTGTHCWCPLE